MSADNVCTIGIKNYSKLVLWARIGGKLTVPGQDLTVMSKQMNCRMKNRKKANK